MPERLLNAGEEKDRLVPGLNYRRASTEAAVLHWLYLSHSPRSRMAPPPMELDRDDLDNRRLRRLAKVMHLDTVLTGWLERKRSYDATASVVEQTWPDESIRKTRRRR